VQWLVWCWIDKIAICLAELYYYPEEVWLHFFWDITDEKSFDVLDCEHSHVNHRHSCFQPIVSWWTMTVEPFDVVIRVGHLAECGFVQCDITMQSNQWQICTIYLKLNVETISSDGPHHEWINGMVIALALPNWGQYEFLGGDGQNLLLAGWFGVNFWTQTSTKIPLESSFQRLSIDAIKTWWF
jgi:hypothetical protein